MRPCLSSFRREESGFTLVELAVGLAVGLFLIVMTVSFLMQTLGIVEKLRIEREIRDQGIFAVQTIEREFRNTLEYGGVLWNITDEEVVAGAHGYLVGIRADGDVFQMSVDSGSGAEITSYPGGNLKCKHFAVQALVNDSYVEGSHPSAYAARVIVIEFELEDDEHGISRLFKAAFASAAATGG